MKIDRLKCILGTIAVALLLFNFTLKAQQASITSFSPTSASKGMTVTIKGSGFATAYVLNVYFGVSPATNFTVVNDSSIKATVGNGTSGYISVNTLFGNNPQIKGFTYIPPPPIITSFSPTVSAKGGYVEIHGKWLSGTTNVKFGGINASYSVFNDSTIWAIVGSGASGNVTVITPYDSTSLGGFRFCFPTKDTISQSAVDSFTWHGTKYRQSGTYTFDSLNVAGCDSLTVLKLTVYYPPTITSFSPTSTCPDSTAITIITGNNFRSAKSVTVGGKEVDSFQVNSETSITATVAPNRPGAITVTTDGGAVTSTSSYSNTTGYTAYAYIANNQSNNVSVINTNTNSVVSTVKVGSQPWGVCVSPDGTKTYVTNNNDSTVSVINNITNTVIATIRVGSDPTGISVSPDDTKVYVLNNGTSTLSVIDATNDTVITTISLGIDGSNLTISPDGKKVYVDGDLKYINNIIQVINTNTNTIEDTIAEAGYGVAPYGLCINPDDSKLYVVNSMDNTVFVASTVTNKKINVINVGYDPVMININPEGTKAYVSNFGDNKVSVINTLADTVIKTITVGLYPNGVSFTPDGKKAYVTNYFDNTVSVINTSTDTVIATIKVGKRPFSFGNFIANVPTVCGVPQPVNITSIEAVNKKESVAINWRTATEINTSHFIIQHSTDAYSFTDISTVKAIGSGDNSYSFTDNNLAHGINYYRLQSVDKDGSSSYSKVVYVNFGGNQLFSIAPNPANSFATISFNKTVDKATIAVYDITGKQVITQSLNASGNTYKLNTQSLKSGLYVIKVNTATDRYNEKLLINK